ncbi:hypothetical protein R5W24_004453 [Gemmata sp. JC717]|uniref:phage major capsid protein n=1 Tax=Gemmata algarum TaxID=2975278 RepID=UPI0021BA8BAF|nr:hypothetical protein [Gemmata algarum]MDY3555311.1 hypothetical protein [Gemmata algarum]
MPKQNRQQRRKAAALARQGAGRSAPAVNAAAPKTLPPQRISGRAVPVAIAGAEAPTAEKPATFEMVANTGEPMRIYPWSDPVVVDLETADLSESLIPALYDHWASIGSVVGQVETLAIENKQLIARGRITPVEADANGRGGNMGGEVLKLARQGYQWQASVGADPAQVVQIEPGAVGVANWGREYAGPCIIGRGCKFREMSFVVLGGDRRSSVRVTGRHRGTRAIKGSVPKPKPIQGAAMIPTFEEWLASLGFQDQSQLDATQLANLKILYQDEYPEGDAEETTTETATEDAPAVDPVPAAAAARRPAVRASAPARRVDPIADMNRRYAANAERIERINAVSAEYGNPTVEANGRQVTIAAQAIREGWTADRAELAIMRAGRPNPPASRGQGSGADEVYPQIVGAAVCITAGMAADRVAASVPTALRERVMNEAVSSQFQGFGIQSLMAATIAAAGRQYHGSRKSNEFVRAALDADRAIRSSNPGVGIQASQGFTTVSLSGILGNVANKIMIAAYQAQLVTWPQFVAVRSYGDFKPVFSYRLDMTGAFRKVGQDGELKHVGMQETGYSNQLATYGAIVALTRQMQINDDLGSFLAIPNGLGRMSAIRVEEAAYVLLLSNAGAFFSSGNKNLITGAGSALAIDSLTASETAFMNQVDVNGKPILTTPDRLLLPTTLGVLGNTLYKQTSIATDNVTTGNALAYYENPHAGKYRPVVSPYLNNTAIRDQDNQAISGQSSTGWYQFVDPAVRAALVVGFLNGQQTPTIQDADTDFATLGHQWRAFHDFGVGFEDPTAVVKNAGA